MTRKEDSFDVLAVLAVATSATQPFFSRPHFLVLEGSLLALSQGPLSVPPPSPSEILATLLLEEKQITREMPATPEWFISLQALVQFLPIKTGMLRTNLLQDYSEIANAQNPPTT